MPVLSDATKLTLAGYVPQRNGYDIPGTDSGAVYEYACWNWTLSGGRLTVRDWRSAPSIVDDLIFLNLQDPHGIFAAGVNPAPAGQYHGSQADLLLMANTLAAARTARAGPHTRFTIPQASFASALVRVMLRANGFTPIAGGGVQPYVVTMKSSDWWNTDHWAIGVLLPPNDRRVYIQTVPNTPVSQGCSAVWDEHLPDVTEPVNGLLQVQIDVLDTVPKAPCRGCGQTHGWTPSVVNSWHQCTVCGAIYCPTHGGALGGKLGLIDGTRACGATGCAGRTRLW